ncbi:MAG: AraC family transcriptional regulator [Capsulimonadaceae bacterium]|nr:AraC family transcriptional regulator [Capsulimonadaceae bacterium]
MFQENILFHGSGECPLGTISLIMSVQNAPGVMPRRPMRIYGHYAAVYITRGSGWYSDANGCEHVVREGDIIFVFPELGHIYTPDSGTTWDEVYTVFDGPAFELLRSVGLLDSSRPIRRGLEAQVWIDRLTTIANSSHDDTAVARTRQTIQLLELLTEVLAVDDPSGPRDEVPPHWASLACGVLATNLGQSCTVDELARKMNMSADSFRRRFRADVGVSPIEYRQRKRIELACLLLTSTSMTHAQIAQRLGFSDEYHSSLSDFGKM